MAKHSNNPLKSGTGTGGCQPGSSSYHTRSLCRGWNWLWILSVNSHRTAEHASDCSEVVPRVLTHDQKDSRAVICQELKETEINNPTLLLNVITGDESIVYAYDRETKLQSSQWKSPGSPRPKKAHMQKSKLTTMLIRFFDQEAIVHREFVPPGMRFNADFYRDVLRRLRENVRRKRPQKWPPRQCLSSQLL